MQFNSIAFIFYFLPLFLAVYFIFPARFRSFILLLGSLVFYASASGGNYRWIAVLLVLTLGCFSAGLTLGKPRSGKLLWAYLSALALVLVFFKLYAGGIYLPAGMSFYVFQLAAYLIDVYRVKLQPERDFIRFAGRITMFPRLLSGPLMASGSLLAEAKKPDGERIREGIHLLILGLGLKVILANRLGGLWAQATITGYGNLSTPAAWMALTAYAMQLYFDFYGYSLMAVGLGKILGFDLPKNFDDPYASKSVSEFYRRWHMTLGLWLREYLYIPLGGNRGSTLKTIGNLALVWLFTGLWHGVGGNYLLWAAFLCVMIINERLWLGRYLKKSRILCHVYLVAVILLSWVPFAVGDWNQMVLFLGRLFSIGAVPANPGDYLLWGRDFMALMIAGAVLATPLPGKIWKKISHSTFADVLLVVLFWIAIYFIATAAQDPFLYFQY